MYKCIILYDYFATITIKKIVPKGPIEKWVCIG